MNSQVGVETEEQKTLYVETVFHEIGHVLGIGVFWLDRNNGNVPNTGFLKQATGDMQKRLETQLNLYLLRLLAKI